VKCDAVQFGQIAPPKHSYFSVMMHTRHFWRRKLPFSPEIYQASRLPWRWWKKIHPKF